MLYVVLFFWPPGKWTGSYDNTCWKIFKFCYSSVEFCIQNISIGLSSSVRGSQLYLRLVNSQGDKKHSRKNFVRFHNHYYERTSMTKFDRIYFITC